MASDDDRDEFGRRRLTERERQDVLDLPLAAVWSTLTRAGRIHSVPVHFVTRGADIRVLTESDSVKCRNAQRTGRATLCVETTIHGADRRYATAEGPVHLERPITVEDLAALDRRYGRSDAVGFDAADFTDAVIMVLSPESWIAWSDAD